jgi:predicted dehydrogenase
VRYRAAHAGPREYGCSKFFCDWLYDLELNGGGALMDYCCYGAALSKCLLGMPSRVFGAAGRLRKEYAEVDDNAVVVMSYPRALSIAEASWTQIGNLTSYIPVLYGSTGTLLVEPGKKGRLRLADGSHPDAIELEVPEPAREDRSASAHFVHCLESGMPFMELCSDRVARDAQEILEAGIESVRTGSEVSLPLRRWFP